MSCLTTKFRGTQCVLGTFCEHCENDREISFTSLIFMQIIIWYMVQLRLGWPYHLISKSRATFMKVGSSCWSTSVCPRQMNSMTDLRTLCRTPRRWIRGCGCTFCSNILLINETIRSNYLIHYLDIMNIVIYLNTGLDEASTIL